MGIRKCRRGHRRRSKAMWLLSEAAPFIRRILRKRATDAERTAVAREFADWLEARGDDHVKWFRHPKLRWRETDYGSVSWEVSVWDNRPHGGCSARIDNDWWTLTYPTPEYTKSKDAEDMVRAWLRNGVAVENYAWTRAVAIRIGLGDAYERAVAYRVESRELSRRREIERAARDRKEYAELQRKFGLVYFEHGGGI